MRTQTLLRRADVVVVRFGDKYRQWNAAFEAGYAAALGKPIVTLHDAELTHALKEVDRAAMAVAETPEQVVEILRYAITGVAGVQPAVCAAGSRVRSRSWDRRGPSLFTIIYVAIGVIVASDHHYFASLDSHKQVAEMVLAVILWPLVLFGVDMRF